MVVESVAGRGTRTKAVPEQRLSLYELEELMIRRVTFLLALAAMAATAQAQLIVNQDLGTLGTGSTTNLTGTTAGAGNEATYYLNTSNPTLVWDEEFVYQFTIDSPATYQVSTNAVTGDPDFFLLDSLAAADDGTGIIAASGDLQSDFLDGVPPDFGTSIDLLAGTYYVSIDSFGSGTVSTWDATLTLSGPPTISTFGPVLLDDGFYDRAAGGTADHPYGVQEFTVDTDGSYGIQTDWDNFDGFLYLFDEPFVEDDSTNIALDDDFDPGTGSALDASNIESVALLAGQSYFLVSTTFGGNAGISDFASLGTTVSGPGIASIVPEPSGLSLILMGFVALALRRRK